MTPAPVVNLCFHGLGRPGRNLEPGEERYWLSVTQFDELLDVVDGAEHVRLTFDDGNSSDVDVALPRLLARRLQADFFIVAGRLGRPGSLDACGISSLAGAGMGIGSHGMCHRSWRGLDGPTRHQEYVVAARVLAAASGGPVRIAACPFGAYDRSVLRHLRSHGYTRVYTVDGGPVRSDAWLQARRTVTAADTPATIAAVLAGRSVASAARDAARRGLKRWR